MLTRAYADLIGRLPRRLLGSEGGALYGASMAPTQLPLPLPVSTTPLGAWLVVGLTNRLTGRQGAPPGILIMITHRSGCESAILTALQVDR